MEVVLDWTSESAMQASPQSAGERWGLPTVEVRRDLPGHPAPEGLIICLDQMFTG